MKGTLCIMDRTGHTEVPWDTDCSTGPLDPKVANEKFDHLVRTGALVYDMDREDRVKRFDPERHTHLLAVPHFVGG